MLPIKTGLKQDALSRLLFNFVLEYGREISGKSGWLEIKWNTSTFSLG